MNPWCRLRQLLRFVRGQPLSNRAAVLTVLGELLTVTIGHGYLTTLHLGQTPEGAAWMHRADCPCRPCKGERYLVLDVSPWWAKEGRKAKRRRKAKGVT